MTDGKTYTVWVECAKVESHIAPIKIDGAEFDEWWGGEEVTSAGLVEFLQAGPEIDLDEAVDGLWAVSEEIELVGPAMGKDFEVTA
jgi:hypothetical protein